MSVDVAEFASVAVIVCALFARFGSVSEARTSPRRTNEPSVVFAGAMTLMPISASAPGASDTPWQVNDAAPAVV